MQSKSLSRWDRRDNNNFRYSLTYTLLLMLHKRHHVFGHKKTASTPHCRHLMTRLTAVFWRSCKGKQQRIKFEEKIKTHAIQLDTKADYGRLNNKQVDLLKAYCTLFIPYKSQTALWENWTCIGVWRARGSDFPTDSKLLGSLFLSDLGYELFYIRWLLYRHGEICTSVVSNQIR